jgi:hypothetical protein
MAHVMSEGRLFVDTFRLGGVASRHDSVRSADVAFLMSRWTMAQRFHESRCRRKDALNDRLQIGAWSPQKRTP